MSFVDWSDPEEMFSLLSEYVEDELGGSHDDAARRHFLAGLVRQLSALEGDFPNLSDDARVAALRGITAGIDAEFDDDPVVRHLVECAYELERIGGQNVA